MTWYAFRLKLPKGFGENPLYGEKTEFVMDARNKVFRLGRQLFSVLTSQSMKTCSTNIACRHLTTVKSARRFNVGVLGAGRIGKLHVGNVLKNRKLNLCWVVEDNEVASGAMMEQYYLQDTPFYKSEKLPSLLSDDSLDGVLILTSTPSHTPLACQALNYGKGVFVEKPAGETVADIRKCFEAAEGSGKPLLVGFNRRFDPTMSEAYRKVTQGAIGKIQYLSFVTRDSPKPSYDFLKSCDTTGCNILADLSVHDIDQLVWITHAQRPKHIYVTCNAFDPVMAEFNEADAISVLIKYESGIIASLNAFRESVYGYDIRMEIFGSEGVVIANNPRETAVTYDHAKGCSQNRLYNSFPQRFEEAFQAELDHFIQCLEGTTTPMITKEENLLVAEIVDKGLESFKQGVPVFFD